MCSAFIDVTDVVLRFWQPAAWDFLAHSAKLSPFYPVALSAACVSGDMSSANLTSEGPHGRRLSICLGEMTMSPLRVCAGGTVLSW